MKHMLLKREDRKPGRIRLSDFYNISRVSNWAFNEKIEYLRTLGALDESNSSNPLVVVSNYITSMPQCMRSSSLYFVCCPNECEGLMGHLEREIAAHEAEPERILDVVARLPSDSVAIPRELSASLRSRLQEVAERNGGKVPLHGRLLAQWMHHAFPRECPFPHELGTTSPVTADEWIKDSGHSNSHASPEEMAQHIRPDDTCPANAKDGCGEVDLPWNPVEELLQHPMDGGNVDIVSGEVDTAAQSGLRQVADGEAEIARLLHGIEEVDGIASGSHVSGSQVIPAMADGFVGSTMVVVGILGTVVALLHACKVSASTALKTHALAYHPSVNSWV
jgi:diadenosine tetraphosphatase ApaH/serine/threonine PP2A family protein phosphatase